MAKEEKKVEEKEVVDVKARAALRLIADPKFGSDSDLKTLVRDLLNG